jgi:hypothetical protein
MPLKEIEDFKLDDYLGIKTEGDRVVSMDATSMGDPRYGDMTSYPESLVMGDSLFPMIYVYYYGDKKNESKIGNIDLMNDGLAEYFKEIKSARGELTAQPSGDKGKMRSSDPMNKGTTSSEILKFKKQSKKYYRMLVSAIDKNPNYLWQLNNTVKNLMAKYRVRLPKNRGNYYSTEDGKNYDYFPMLGTVNSSSLTNCMESLRLMYENGVISSDHDIGIRPLNLYDGKFADELVEFSGMKDTAKILGLPVHGMFTINNRPRTDYMFRTFSGIDIIALASLNTVVSRLEGLTSLSWSVHRGSTPNRSIGKPSAGARARGGRTIAGTMVFTLADHHPLLELLPGDFPMTSLATLEKDPDLWRPLMMADQIPPFDLVLTMTNEYGHASVVSLYGIEVQDEGTVLGIDNLVTEMVIQYTAVAMDPIMMARRDEYGNIDPYGLLQGGYSRMYKHREMVVRGVAYSDLEDAYEAQYDATFAALERRLTYARQDMIDNKREQEEKRREEREQKEEEDKIRGR